MWSIESRSGGQSVATIVTLWINKEWLAHDIGDHQIPYALDEEVVDELMYLPYATIYGKDERPYSPKTLAEAFEIYTFEATSETEKLFYVRLFKGLNKKLPMPVLLTSLREHTYEGYQQQVTCVYSCCMQDESDIVSFNPKNLMKYLKYTEAEAKLFFKNIRGGHSTMKLKMLKSRVALRDNWNVRVNQHPETYSCWSTPRLIDGLALDEKFSDADMDRIVSLAELPIPITDLATWKRVASKRYERTTGNSFDELTKDSQNRHIVNCIRHNSIYSMIWKRSERQISTGAHHIAFDKVCRKIIQTFPSLAKAAREQLNGLHDGNR